MKIGITGHRRLADATAWKWVAEEMSSIIERAARPLVGLSSLAIGADQLFADIILERGGELWAIIPFPGYEQTFAEGHERREYERLLGRAAHTETLLRTGSDEEAYMSAGQSVADRSDLLLAVWDGRPAAGLGGTADAVRYATLHGRRVVQLDPNARLTRALTSPFDDAR